MDEFGLPVVGAGIDYTKVECLPQKQLLAMVNSFVVHTVHFLNSFAHDADNKLSNTSKKIQQLEICLSLLEAKLSNIAGIEDVEGKVYTPPESLKNAGVCESPRTSRTKEHKEEKPTQPSLAQTAEAEVAPDTHSSPPPNQSSPVPPSTSDPPAPALPPPPPPPPGDGTPQLTIKDDPQYKEWFKKLKYGANKAQIAIAMRAQGLDPDLLGDPDMPISGGTASSLPPLVSENNLVDDFSSSSLSEGENSSGFSD